MMTRALLFPSTFIALALATSLCHASTAYTPYAFETLAGLAGVSGTNDGTGDAARFFEPAGAAVDTNGNLFVTDTRNHTIRKVTPAGAVTTFAGAPGVSGTNDGLGSAARFNMPAGVAVDKAGNVFVGDTGNHTIREVTPAGMVSTLAGLGGVSGTNNGTGNAARFYAPAGVSVDTNGNIFVADTFNDMIREVSPAGAVTLLAGLAGQPGTNDGTGTAARFQFPYGVAADTSGNVFVADAANNTIRKVTSAGAVTTLAGLGGVSGTNDGIGNAARFLVPYAVAVDANDTVFVADTENDTIRKITPAAVVTTLAGLAGTFGTNDGTGSFARFGTAFRGPTGLAVDSAGNVYVADTYNHTIRNGNREQVPAVIVASGPGFGFSGGHFGFMLAGPPGQLVVVEASSNLMSWLPIWTNTFSGNLNFSDPQSGTQFNRIYRAVTP